MYANFGLCSLASGLGGPMTSIVENGEYESKMLSSIVENVEFES